jgi:Protein of unknown function (DUF3617)
MQKFGAVCVLMALAVPAAAADLPLRKSGLWDIKLSFEGRPITQSFQQCIDPETDAIMQSSASNLGSQACAKRDIVKAGDKMTIDSVCTVAGQNATSHAEVTGSFDSAYTMTVASKTDAGAINMTIAGKWLGPCEAGQKPGDLILPGGMKINLRDMAGRGGALGGAPPVPPR